MLKRNANRFRLPVTGCRALNAGHAAGSRSLRIFYPVTGAWQPEPGNLTLFKVESK